MNNRRAACVVIDGEKILIGHAPNFKPGDNTWDLPKGHLEVGESYEACGWRELEEETGFTKENLDIKSVTLSDEFSYRGKMKVIFIELASSPSIQPHCISQFDWKGTKLPELSEFMWINYEESTRWLYKSHEKTTVPHILHFLRSKHH